MKNKDIPKLIELGLIPAYILSGWDRGVTGTEKTSSIKDDVQNGFFFLKASYLLLTFSSVAFCVSAISYHSKNDSPGRVLMTGAIAAGVFALFALLIFVRACSALKSKALGENLELLGAYCGGHIRKLFGMDETELRKICSEVLVRYAGSTIEAEHERLKAEQELIKVREKEGWNSPGAITWQNTAQKKSKYMEDSRNIFKRAHGLFREFDLVNEKWDEYFSAATPSTVED